MTFISTGFSTYLFCVRDATIYYRLYRGTHLQSIHYTDEISMGNASAYFTATQRETHPKQETPEFVMMWMPEQDNAFSHWFTQTKGPVTDLGIDPRSVSLTDLETPP